MRIAKLLTALLAVVAMCACDGGPKGSQGFSLPDGDAQIGRANFIGFRCNACHTIADVAQLETDGEPEISVALGGTTTRVRTYGQLVTSIINPSHRLARGYPEEAVAVDGESRMRNYNDAMSVSELIDLVAFVQSNYVLEPYQPSQYPLFAYYDR